MVALVVAALIVTGVPAQVAGRAREVVCRIVGAQCAPAGGAPVAVAADAEVQPFMSRPIAAVTLVDEERGDGWRDCPEDRLCFWPEPHFGGPPYLMEVTEADPDFQLPEPIRDSVGSWVNNTPWDLCGENLDFWSYRNEEPLTGSSHPDDGNRSAFSPRGDRLDHIGTCDDVTLQPDPSFPILDENDPAPERSDCGYANICLYEGPNFTGEVLLEVDVSACADDEDCRITLPPGSRDMVSSWSNASAVDFCLVDEDEDRSYPTQTERGYASSLGYWTRHAQDAEMDAGSDDSVDYLERCDRELETLPIGSVDGRGGPAYPR